MVFCVEFWNEFMHNTSSVTVREFCNRIWQFFSSGMAKRGKKMHPVGVALGGPGVLVVLLLCAGAVLRRSGSSLQQGGCSSRPVRRKVVGKILVRSGGNARK